MRRVVLAYLPLALWAAGVLAIGALDTGAVSLQYGSDKAAHFAMYGVGGALAGWVARRRGSVPGRRSLAFVALVATVDELNQSRLATRDADPWDWVADLAGALVLYIAVKLFRRNRSG